MGEGGIMADRKYYINKRTGCPTECDNCDVIACVPSSCPYHPASAGLQDYCHIVEVE
jgi:hypothetical protein